LIVVHVDGDQQRALEFCDEIRTSCPRQPLLMAGSGDSGPDYAVSEDIPSILQRVDEILGESAKSDLTSAA